jgi:two-component system C4-dicarboxylate transport sensor histidine kinase DctB
MKNQPGPKKLSIHARREENYVFIDISDTGPGISKDKVHQLFKPFYTTKPQGTGLGLILSRNLALKMGGNLEFLENSRGTGAHFRLSLPCT